LQLSVSFCAHHISTMPLHFTLISNWTHHCALAPQLFTQQ
jgi:hypothetical protein